MSEDTQKSKSKQNWYPKRGEERYHKSQKYIHPKKEEPYQKSRQLQLDQKFVKIMQGYPQCFYQTKIVTPEKLNIPIDDCLVILIKSEQKQRKKSDFQKNAYQKPNHQEQYEEEREPEWMRDENLTPDINGIFIFFFQYQEFQLKTLEYEFKKVLNVKKTIDDFNKQNYYQENFSDNEEFIETISKPIVSHSQTTNVSSKKSRFEEKFNPEDGFMGMPIQSPKKKPIQEFSLEKQVKVQQELAETKESDDDETLFLKLVAKSELRLQIINNDQKIKEKSLKLPFDQLPQFISLQTLCNTIYHPSKEYNKLKLFIDFTRNVTKLDINDNCWYYEDPQKKIQGPFSSVDMDVWNLDQYFPPNLQISWKQTNEFLSISSFRENPLLMIEILYMQCDVTALDCLNYIQKEKTILQEIPSCFDQLSNNLISGNTLLDGRIQNHIADNFQQPNFQIPQNNFQINQNNFSLFNTLGQQPYMDLQAFSNQSQNFLLNQSNTKKQDFQPYTFQNFNDFFMNGPQNSFFNAPQIQNNEKQKPKQSLDNEVDFFTKLLGQPEVKKSKKIDIQTPLNIETDTKYNENNNKFSENDLKRMLGINHQNFFNF